MTKRHQHFLSAQTAITMVPAPVGLEVGHAVPDHGTPFFLSYARAENNPPTRGKAHFSDQMAERFYFDLSENVGQLIPLRTGADVGFMNPGTQAGFIDTGMQAGVQWIHELLHAAGTCQMLIPLLSAPYLSSEWCGREWCAFARRTVERLPGMNASTHQGCIIPVRWAPVLFPLRPPVSESMIFSPTGDPDPDLPARYRTEGVFGLLRTKQEDSYQIIVWQLAKHISRVYHSQRVRSRKYRLEDLENVFREAVS